MPELRLDQVSKRYKVDRRIFYAVEDISLTVAQGEFVFLIGSSGAGKSTVLKMMGNELRPDKGSVFLGDKNISRQIGPMKAYTARKFGIVSQQSQLIRKRTIEDNLLIAANAAGMRQKGPQASKKALGLVGMSYAEKKFPAELSLGECRRVELARALINSPPILLLDELTANLDDDTIWDMMHLLKELNDRGTTVVMATHASQYVNIMRRRVVTLVDGHLVGDVPNGKYGDIVEPVHPFAAQENKKTPSQFMQR